MIPTMIELRQIQRQVMLGDVVERPNDPALEKAERGFNRVRMDGEIPFLAGVFPCRVIHGMMGVSAIQS